ncbi:FAS1-like dehydratase domain-containing protein [Nocardia jejuensis]|uniref:FAS1-like dehydratase domain-containing protein n=1 Tax=Nocardia jejuensis TaxID=328049 RepID=UPI000A0557DF|nr:MaoC family dehydratase N-terminal domain-containing protein [Nocardia jejuensis]
MSEHAPPNPDLHTAAQALIGGPGATPRPGRDPVNQPMINSWLEALGDANPIHTDHTAARNAGHHTVVAPPAMTQAWTMPTLGAERDDDHPTVKLFELLDSAGYTSLLATDCDTVYHRYTAVGEHLSLHAELAACDGPKKTALGEGWFCTVRSTWKVGDEIVADMNFRMLKFRPAHRTAPADHAPGAPRTPMTGENSRYGGAPTRLVPEHPPRAAVGDRLPELVIDATPTFIVAAALATRDFQPVHHDRDTARARGSQDIFANILTDTGLVQRFVTDWAGQRAQITSLALRLGAPWYAYDTLRLAGEVRAVHGQRVSIAVTGTCALGKHIIATVEVVMDRTAGTDAA